MIVSRDSIRRALATALHLDPKHSVDDAVEAVAQAMGLAREVVREVVEETVEAG